MHVKGYINFYLHGVVENIKQYGLKLEEINKYDNYKNAF